MDCQIMRTEEIFEKYILQNLKDSEKLEFEKHLNGCESCRKELDNQRILISGIRAIGRTEMKQEIRRRVDIHELNAPQMNWGMLAKIAAVLFVFVMTPAVYFMIKSQDPQVVSPPTAAFEMNIPQEEIVTMDLEVKSEGEETALLQKKAAPRIQLGQVLEILEAETEEKADQLLSAGDISMPPKESGESRKLIPRKGEPNLSPEVMILLGKDSVPVGETSDFKPAQPKSKLNEDQSMGLLAESTQRPDTLQFVANGQAITINLISGAPAFAVAAAGGLPEKFPVTIVARDSLQLEMIWVVPSGFPGKQISKIELQPSEESMRVIFKSGFIYVTDMRSDSTQAILQK